ncbi:MAG: RidA family protein [Paracoccaceae bacterium]
MTTITRIATGQRMSQAVIHGQTIYLAGQVGTPGTSVTAQTQEILEKIESLLEQAGSDKTQILSATIWMASMDSFDEMNAVWDAWVPEGHAPARATGESALATPEHLVEILIIAAKA